MYEITFNKGLGRLEDQYQQMADCLYEGQETLLQGKKCTCQQIPGTDYLQYSECSNPPPGFSWNLTSDKTVEAQPQGIGLHPS